MNSQSPPIAANQIGRRGNARLRLNLPARLQSVSSNQRCAILNISGSGARLQIDHPPKEGRTAILTCDQLDTLVRIVWVRDRECGVEFEGAVPHELILSMRETANNLTQREKLERARFARDWVAGKI